MNTKILMQFDEDFIELIDWYCIYFHYVILKFCYCRWIDRYSVFAEEMRILSRKNGCMSSFFTTNWDHTGLNKGIAWQSIHVLLLSGVKSKGCNLVSVFLMRISGIVHRRASVEYPAWSWCSVLGLARIGNAGYQHEYLCQKSLKSCG